PEHRAAAIDRPAIAVNPHDIDVARALRLAFGEDQRAFVDHRVKRALDDFLIGDFALLDPRLLAEFLDDLGDARAFRRLALVVIVGRARLLLLPPAALGGERVADAFDAVRVAVPADVDAREVAHLERPHRHAEFDMDLVDLRRGRAFEQQLHRLHLARLQHAVADEAVAHARDHRDLADLL